MTMGAVPGREAATGAVEHARLGPYRLIQRLGEGGMGVVHLALDPSGRAVAIKVLRPHIAHDADARRRLAREVQTLSRVRNPRIAAVLDADVDGDQPYIVTEYVPGPPLDQVVRDEGPLHGEQLLRLGRGLSVALRAIHEVGVIHRDLKPGNVLIVDDEPVVIDFGIAHVADDVRLTSTGLVMGTPGYLSPEVVEGALVTEATDWWGFAATLSFAASGLPPFGRGPMPVVLDRVSRGQADLEGVDPRLVPLLEAALSPYAESRPDADEVVAALERYAVGGPATVVLPTRPAGDNPGERMPMRAAGAGAYALSETRVQYPTGAGQSWDGARQDRDGADHDGAGAERGGGPGDFAGEESDWQAAWDSGAGQPDPRINRAPRTGTLLAGLAAVVALAANWPLVAVAVVVIWSLAARFADRSVTSLVLRRHLAGPRRSDVPLTVVASPWHLLRAALATVLALLLPAFVAVATAVSVSLLLVLGSGASPAPERSLPMAAGSLLGTLMLWWGPGGASMRRGSRSLVRGAVHDPGLSRGVALVLLAVAAGLALLAWSRGGMLQWWPLERTQLPFASLFTDSGVFRP